MIFAWQTQIWQRLNRLREKNRLPHALLFVGPLGIGKRQLAEKFAHALLCQQPDVEGLSCGQCHSCRLTQAQFHPDFKLIEPEKEGYAIKIDQVRALSEFIQNTSHQGGYRVVIMQPATAMNDYASNAFLKMLEEPTPDTVIILVSDQRSMLPITIVSRCQQIRFSVPARHEALSWLNRQTVNENWASILDATHGAPLLALNWQQQGVWALQQNFFHDLCALTRQEADPLALSVQWKEANVLWILDMFFQWVLKIMKAQHVSTCRNECPTSVTLEKISIAGLLAFADYLQCLRVDALGPYHLNQQLLLEALFIHWANMSGSYVSR